MQTCATADMSMSHTQTMSYNAANNLLLNPSAYFNAPGKTITSSSNNNQYVIPRIKSFMNKISPKEDKETLITVNMNVKPASN